MRSRLLALSPCATFARQLMRLLRSPSCRAASLVGACVLLGSCGNSERRPLATAQPDIRIDATNALAVASSAYHAAFGPVRLARVASAFFDVPPPPPPSSPSSQPIVVQEVAGPEGGTAIYSWGDRDGDESYSTGDTFTVAFSDYGDSGSVLAGALVFDDVAIDGDLVTSLNWMLAARLDLLALRLTVGEVSTTVTGTFDFAREKRATVQLMSLTATTDVQLGVRTLHRGSVIDRNDYVLDFTMGLFAEGSVDDPLLGGALTFHTEGAMTGLQFLPDPSAGAFTIEGADGTTLTLVALDFFTLEIQVDENGDGEVDVTIPAEWATL